MINKSLKLTYTSEKAEVRTSVKTFSLNFLTLLSVELELVHKIIIILEFIFCQRLNQLWKNN